MVADELYVESFMRSRYDEGQSVRSRMVKEALRLRSADRQARRPVERAAAAGRTGRSRRPIGRRFPD